MNCKVCGTLMGDMDLFCKVCGAKNGDTTIDVAGAAAGVSMERNKKKETVRSVSNSKENNEFVWNIYEFPKPKKTEEIDIQWPTEDYRKPRRRELDDDEPICWDLDRKKKEPVKPPRQEQKDAFFESIESEFETTRKNIINEYESVKNRKSVFEEEDVKASSDPFISASSSASTADKGASAPQEPKEQSDLEEFGEGLPEGFFENKVPEPDEIEVQSFADLPGGYPRRRSGLSHGNTEDTREATKRADRNEFRRKAGLPEEKKQQRPEEHKQEESKVHIQPEAASAKESLSAPQAKETPLPEQSLSEKPEEKPQGQEEVKASRDTDTDLGEMEKFFTFSKKNEEFQKLLDQEYQKIQEKNADRPELPENHNRITGAIGDTLNFTFGEESELEPAADGQKAEGCERLLESASEQREKMPELSEEETQDEYFGFIPRRERKKKHGHMEEETEKRPQPEPEIQAEETVHEAEADTAVPLRRNPFAAHLAEMAAARDSFFRDSPEELTPAPFNEYAVVEPHEAAQTRQPQNTEVMVTVAVKSNGMQGTTTRQTISMNPAGNGDSVITTETMVESTSQAHRAQTVQASASEVKSVYPPHLYTDVEPKSIYPPHAGAKPKSIYPPHTHTEPESIYPAYEEDDRSMVNEPTRELPPQKPTMPEVRRDKPEPEKLRSAETKEEAVAEFAENLSEEPDKAQKKYDDGLPFETIPEQKMQDFWLNYSYEGDEKEKRLSAGKIALIVVGAILTLEIAALCVTMLLPESGAAKVITAGQIKAVEGIQNAVDKVGSWFTSDQDKENEADQPQEQLPEPEPTEPNPVPEADKNKLIEKELYQNKNIQIISKADQLVFEEGKDYGLKDLNESRPIENNIWFTNSAGETIYYDQSIIGAVIAYDSMWIDYVNNADQSVFNVLKPDSMAYRNTKAFSKVGKIYESFSSLSFGEIRQGEKGFYVFTQEVIEKNEGGKISTVNNDWIYYLEPIDGKMMVVNYI